MEEAPEYDPLSKSMGPEPKGGSPYKEKDKMDPSSTNVPLPKNIPSIVLP